MKKVFQVLVLVFALACTLCFVGCGSGVDQAYIDKLEGRIISLEIALSEDESLMVDYEEKINELEKDVSKLQSANKSLQNKLASYDTSISNLEKDIDNMKGASDAAIDIYLADQYYLVVGDTFQLFYRSVIKAVDPYGYYIHVTGDYGHPYNRYYEWTPDKAGTYSIKIDVCDDNGNILGSDSTKLIVRSANATTTQKTVLCIGDSLTSSGHWVARAISRYQKAGGKVQTVGTISKYLYSANVNYEGRAGWQWSSYLTKYSSDTLSPFSTDGKTASIRDYCTRNGFPEITDFYILMTFNGLPGTFQTFDWDNSFIKDAKKLIDLIHSEYPNAKISLMSLPLTSTKSGLGAYYQVSQSYSDNYGKAVTVLHYDDFLEQWCKMDEYKSFMRYIDAKAQFDSENNMPSTTKAVNNTLTTVTEEVGTSMGLHPTEAGYQQIGDAVFRALMSNW